MQEVVERIRRRIAENLGVPVEKVTDTASLEEDLNADSLETLQIIMLAEEEAGITIPDESKDKIHTLDDLKKVITEARK